MKDDDKDFTFGKIDDDFANDDGWGKFDDQSDSGDFALDDAEKSKLSAAPDFDDTLAGEKHRELGDESEAPSRSRRASSRMVYYGLLVIILSAAGFYYFTTSPAPPGAKTDEPPTTQTVAMPERPAGDSVVETPGQAPPTEEGQVAVATAVPKGTLREIPPSAAPPEPIGSSWSGGESVPAVPATKAAVREPPAALASPAPPQKVEKVEKVETAPPSVKPATVARTESLTPAAPIPTAPPKAQPEPIAKPKPQPEPVAKSAPPVSGSGPYMIQAGAYAETANRDQAIKKIRQLGFEAQATPVTRTQSMTRLLVGVYATDVARAKAKELAPRAPDLFVLNRGGQLAVYAGSYSHPDKAREAAAELARRGVQSSEERTDVESTLWRLTFGGFADAATANAAAAKAKAAGLEARVIRKP